MSYFKTRKLILFITIIYTAVVTTVLLHRFWQYEAFYYDHGMMESTAYQVSQFQLPLHERDFGKVPIYIDHLYPSLQIVLAPFYWFYDSYETPIVVMSVLIGLSVLIGYEIAKLMIKNQLMIYALLFAYMFYIGLQNALIFFVHDVTMQVPFLMLLFWSILKDRYRSFYLLLFINLGFKESVSVTGMAIGISLLFFRPSWRKHAVFTIIISFVYGILASKLIIPYFRYISFGSWEKFAYEPQFSANIIDYATRFFDTDQKRETIFTSLATFGFLPLLSLFSLPLIVQDFAQRFVLFDPTSPLRQGLNLHYNASLAVLLFVGSVFAVHKLQSLKFYKKLIPFHAILIILATVVYHRFIYHGPLGLIYNRDFFNITRNMKFMDDFVAKIPLKGKVMVQNNIAPRFTHYDNMHILLSEKHFHKIDPDVVVLDFRPGQNINNFWPMTEGKMQDLADILLKDKSYKAIFQEPHRYIFVKSS